MTVPPTDPLLIDVPMRLDTPRLVIRCPQAGDGWAYFDAVDASLQDPRLRMLQALTEMALERLAARRVEIRCDARNARSWRVAERCGFVLEGTLRNEALDVEGRPRDTRVYARVADVRAC